MPPSRTAPKAKPKRGQIKLPKVAEYVKNVGKSVVFASVDVVKENTEGMADFLESNEEIFKEGYARIKDFRGTLKAAQKSITDSKLFKALEIGYKNTMEDLKTGNFYNDRTDEYGEEAIGLGDDEFGWEDDDYSSSSSSSDDYDFDDDDSYAAAYKISSSIHSDIGAAASMQASAIAESTEYTVKSNINLSKIMMAHMDTMSAKISSSIGSVYVSTDSINKFLSNQMTTHIENSKKYYESSLKIMEEQHAMIKEFTEMQRNLYHATQKETKASALSESMNYNGSMNLTGYAKTVMNNIKRELDGLGLGAMDMGKDANPFLLFAASPMKLLMENVIETIIPETFKKTLGSFDRSITGLFGNVIADLNSNKNNFFSNEIMQFVSKIFGIDIKDKKTINTANYERGPVPFDGITRKTITEVIPGYLARIESALTGREERFYDVHAGGWKNASNIGKEFDREKRNAVASANYEAMSALSPTIDAVRKAKGNDAGDKFEQKIYDMFATIWQDGGKVYTKSNSSKGSPSKYYKFTQDEWDLIMDAFGKNHNALGSIAANTMQAKERWNQTMTDMERSGGLVNLLYNGAYSPDGKFMNGTRNDYVKLTKGAGPLASSVDDRGNNVFWYLRNILNAITARWNKGRVKTAIVDGITIVDEGGSSRNRESSTSGDDGDAPPSDSEIESDLEASFTRADMEEIKRQREEAEKDKHKFDKGKLSEIIKSKFAGKSGIGGAIGGLLGGAAEVLEKPFDFVEKKIKAADDALFKMMFGDNDLKDDEGKPITNAFEYVRYKVKKTFDDIFTHVKTFLNTYIYEPLIKPMYEKYIKPVWDNIKEGGKSAKDTTKKSFSHVFGGIFGKKATETMQSGGVVDSSDVADSVAESAGGRLVTKTGLTMISPGEIIIPASTDKKKQKRMLANEKAEKKRILDSITFHAEGTKEVEKPETTLEEDIERAKMYIERILEENKGGEKIAKIGAGGSIGLVGGILSGIPGMGPVLGALVGSTISMVKNSDTFKRLLFGDATAHDEEGNVTEREGGVIPKSVYNLFNKSGADIPALAVLGGLAGLFTPFGLLGGSAIGTGVALLKNSDSFHKFIFGDEESGEEALIDEKKYNKFKEKVQKGLPKAMAGAALGAFFGPFGLLGNAAIGAGLGLATTTNKFQEFVFGPKDDPNAPSLKNALITNVVGPAKEIIATISIQLKEYAKKNILDPLKNFWDPFKQTIKNTIEDIGEGIKDRVHKSFEKFVALPMGDWLVNRVLKPVGKIAGGIAKLPLKAASAIITSPFKLLGAVGNQMQMRNIQRGRAGNMSAEERLAFRQQHKILNFAEKVTHPLRGRGPGFLGNRMSARDAFNLDVQLAGMSNDDLSRLTQDMSTGLENERSAQRKIGDLEKALSAKVSRSGLYNLIGFGNAQKLNKLMQKGDMGKVNKFITNVAASRGISPDEVVAIVEQFIPDIQAIKTAKDELKLVRKGMDEVNQRGAQLMGVNTMNRRNRRILMNLTQGEIDSRNRKEASAQEKAKTFEFDPENPPTDTLDAVNLVTGTVKKVGTGIWDTLKTGFDKLIETDQFLLKRFVPGYDPNGSKEQTLALLTQMETRADVDNDAQYQHLRDASAPTDDELGWDDAEEPHQTTANVITQAVEQATRNTTNFDPVTGMLVPADKDSKEYKEFEKAREEEEAEEAEATEAQKKHTGLLSRLSEKLLFKSKDKDSKREKGGILDRLTSVLEGGARFLGFGLGTAGKALKIVAGISLLGFASEFVKTNLLPPIKKFLFGEDEDGDGKGDGGLVGGIKKKLVDDPDSLFSRFVGYFDKKYDEFMSKGGIGGLLEGILNKAVTGIGYSVENIVTPLVALLIKNLPSILMGVIKGIGLGITTALGFDKGKKASGAVTVEADAASQAINQYHKSASSAFNSSTLDQSAIKSAADSAISSSTGSITASAEDLFGDPNWVKSGGLSGLLGEKSRTNEVVIDENGVDQTWYTRGNKQESVASGLVDAGGRAFINAAAGVKSPLAGLFSKMSKTKLTKAKSVGGFFGRMLGKITGGTIGAGTNAGTAVRNFFMEATGHADQVVRAVDTAVDVAEAAKSTGKIAGLFKKVFDGIAKSSIGTKIAGFVAKAKGVAREKALDITTKALSKIGSKLGSTVAGKAIGKVATKIATALGKFSNPIGWALLAADFIYGFDQCETILGVAAEDYQPTTAMKVATGLLHLVITNLTFGLLETSTAMDFILEFIAPLFGEDTEKIMDAREQYADTISQWNAEHPDDTYDNLKDFNNRNKWYTKQLKSVKRGFSDLVSGKTFKTIGDAFSESKEDPDAKKDFGSLIVGGLKEVFTLAFEGKVNDVLGYDLTVDEDSTIGRFARMSFDAMKIVVTPVATTMSIVSKAVRYIGDTFVKFPTGFANMGEAFTNQWKYALDGDLMGVIKNKVEPTDNFLVDLICQGGYVVGSALTLPFAAVTSVVSMGVKAIAKAIDGGDNSKQVEANKEADRQTIEDAKNGDISVFSKKYWTNSNYEGTGILGGLANIQMYIEKVINVPIVLVKSLVKSFDNVMGDFFDWISGKKKEDDSAGTARGLAASGDNQIMSYHNIKNLSGPAKGAATGALGIAKALGKSGAGHAYQKNPYIASMPYGNSTIGRAGCAPVAAANLINGMSVYDAAQYAERHGKVNANGTDISYFNSILSNNGISNSTTNSPGTVTNALRNGQKAVMLGRDGAFGSRSHFMTAVGMDAYGNIIVEDPDSPYGRTAYRKSDVANGMISSVVTRGNGRRGFGTSTTHVTENGVEHGGHGGSFAKSTTATATEATKNESIVDKFLSTGKNILAGLYGSDIINNLFGEGTVAAGTTGVLTGNRTSETNSSGLQTVSNPIKTTYDTTTPGKEYSLSNKSDSSLTGDDHEHKIWNYLRNKGYSPAGAAGIMGYLAQESGMAPFIVERSQLKRLGYKSDESKKMTEDIMSGKFSKDSFVNEYFGYGLPQFTYHTWKKELYENTVEKGKPIDRISNQLDYLSGSWKTYVPKLHNKLKFATDPQTAAIDVLHDYGMPNWKTVDSYLYDEERKSYAQRYYDKYKDQSGSGRYQTGVAANALNNYTNRGVFKDGIYYEDPSMIRSGSAREPMMDYTTFLNTIVSILSTIANNTALLTAILDVLSEKFDIKIDKSDIETAAKKSNVEAKTALEDLVKRSTNNVTGVSQLLNNKDTNYLLELMSSIASD